MDFEEKTSYVLGLASILLALSFMSPLGGLVSGIIGFNISKKSKSDISKKAKKLNKIGIIISVVILALILGLTVFAITQGLATTPGFPTY